MGLTFNGGFVKPHNITPSSVTCDVPSDIGNSYSIIDDNTTYKSKLFPNLVSTDITSLSNDPTQILVWWDSTTHTFPGSPNFVESPPDDYHPMPEIEYAEMISPLVGTDRVIRTPHYIWKQDSTSQWLGKDRWDNFMTEPLTNFGGQFNWYNGSTSISTYGGGTLLSCNNTLHFSFYNNRFNDGTAWFGDLYHTTLNQLDGTFNNPVLLEKDIYLKPISAINEGIYSDNPKMINIPNFGIVMATLSWKISTNTISGKQIYIDLKLSKDNGSTWSSLNKIPFTQYTEDNRPDTGAAWNIEFADGPHLHLAYGDGKFVILVEFFTNLGLLYTKRANILISDDNLKSFNKPNIDFSRIVPNQVSVAWYITSGFSIMYDVKISKFIIAMSSTTFLDLEAVYNNKNSMVFLCNFDSSLTKWDIIQKLNMTSVRVFKDKASRPYSINTPVLGATSDNGMYFHGSSNMYSFVDENNIGYVVINGGMQYKDVSAATWVAYDDYGDYSNHNPATLATKKFYSWISNPIMVPLEFYQATDSYLNQFKFANVPWRSRKLSDPNNITHKNHSTLGGGIYGQYGASVSLFYDGMINDYSEITPSTNTDAQQYPSPAPRFFIDSITSYDNNMYAIGSTYDQQTIGGVITKLRIPTLMYRPTWSNVNVKPRKLFYLTPTRHFDSTYAGWGKETAAAGEQILTEYPGNGDKYWEIKFERTEATQGANFNCGLNHLGDNTPFKGLRGCAWDMDSTRGAFAHFVCYLDSIYQNNDITSLVHCLAISNDIGDTNIKTSIQTWLGKGHFAFRSSGVLATENYETFFADTTRPLEFLVIANKKNNASSHEHRGYFKYQNNSDWTLVYCKTNVPVSASPVFSSSPGFRLGNLWRWPSTIGGGATNAVYFKYHAEGWSAWDMMHQTSNSNNKEAILAQPCTPFSTHLKNGVRINWSGQDATANALFKIVSNQTKNAPVKMFDFRPSIGWKSVDGTRTTTLTIDFGKSITFNSVALYNHNLLNCIMYYGQENSTTDMTAFLFFEQALMIDGTDFYAPISFDWSPTGSVSVVDTNTLLVYDQKFLKYCQEMGEHLIEKYIIYYKDSQGVFICKKFNKFNILNDSSVYVEFKDSNRNWLNPLVDTSFTSPFLYKIPVLENKHLVKLTSQYTARYIKVEIGAYDIGYLSFPAGKFTDSLQPNYDGYFKIGSLMFGNLFENENPILKGMKTSFLSPTSLQDKIAGAKYPVQVSTENRKNRFEVSFQANLMDRGNQFEQLQYFVEHIGGRREVFLFSPRLSVPNTDDENSMGEIANLYLGIEKITSNFYLVRATNDPTTQKDGNLATLSMTMEEVK